MWVAGQGGRCEPWAGPSESGSSSLLSRVQKPRGKSLKGAAPDLELPP